MALYQKKNERKPRKARLEYHVVIYVIAKLAIYWRLPSVLAPFRKQPEALL